MKPILQTFKPLSVHAGLSLQNHSLHPLLFWPDPLINYSDDNGCDLCGSFIEAVISSFANLFPSNLKAKPYWVGWGSLENHQHVTLHHAILQRWCCFRGSKKLVLKTTLLIIRFRLCFPDNMKAILNFVSGSYEIDPKCFPDPMKSILKFFSDQIRRWPTTRICTTKRSSEGNSGGTERRSLYSSWRWSISLSMKYKDKYNF